MKREKWLLILKSIKSVFFFFLFSFSFEKKQELARVRNWSMKSVSTSSVVITEVSWELYMSAVPCSLVLEVVQTQNISENNTFGAHCENVPVPSIWHVGSLSDGCLGEMTHVSNCLLSLQHDSPFLSHRCQSVQTNPWHLLVTWMWLWGTWVTGHGDVLMGWTSWSQRSSPTLIILSFFLASGALPKAVLCQDKT